jgi:transposase
MRTIRKRRSYSKEFKQEAVKLVMDTPEKSVSSISQELGISSDILSRWKREYEIKGEESFPGKGIQNSEGADFQQLQKEFARVKRERDILKKALAIFSRIPE